MKRHPLDLFSLLSGLFVTGIAVAALTGAPLTRQVAVWLWPTVLIAAGVVVLAAVLAGRRDPDPAPVRTDDPVHAAARAEVEQADPFASHPDLADDGGGGDPGRAATQPIADPSAHAHDD